MEKDIIHVHNREIVQRETICVYLQFLNTELIKYKETKIIANSHETVINAFEDSLMY